MYLGLPFVIGRSKTQVFKYIIDRVRKKLNGWKEKFLTAAGKEVLIKSVIQAIPNHLMQCFHIPDSVCDDIMSLIRRFWWGKGCEEQTICWKSWNDMCRPKGCGGMGFKNLKVANLSLLAKQGWRIIKNPNSLLAKVFKSRYFPQHGFMQATLGSRPSYIWRSMLIGREILELGIRFQIGNGQNVHIWNDKWLPIPYSFQLSSVNRYKWPNATVADLKLTQDNDWNLVLLNQLFLPYEVEAILQIPLSIEDSQDKLVWHHSSNGLYTVKSGYIAYQKFQEALSGGPSVDMVNSQKSVWNQIWKWPILPKIRHFTWRAMHNVLPSGANLSKKGIKGVVCPHCSCILETDKHIFYECPYARKIWNQLKLAYIWEKWQASSFQSLISGVIIGEPEHIVTLSLVTLWLIWKARCAMYYDKKFTPPSQIVTSAYSLAQENLQPTVIHQEDAAMYKWSKPKSGVVSINVDAGINEDGMSGYGVIIRDSECNILEAEAGPLLRNISVEHAEIRALVCGLLLARKLNQTRVEIYTDSKLGYNRIASKEKDCSLVSPLVQQFRQISSDFSHFKFGLVRRQGNVPAHLLARFGRTLCNSQKWGSKPPNDVLLAVHFDSVNFNE